MCVYFLCGSYTLARTVDGKQDIMIITTKRVACGTTYNNAGLRENKRTTGVINRLSGTTKARKGQN